MKPSDVGLAKGVKDWYGSEAMLRNWIRDSLRAVFERYGIMPLETPAIERLETIQHKGGTEIQKEVFTLTDQGKRKLALRFDHTVPLARFVASHRELKLPLKRYALGEVFRDGPTQPEQGRYRIFTQCDVDILGVKEMTAEVELLNLAADAFQALGLGEIVIKLNNRKLLDGLLDAAGVSPGQRTDALVSLDKMDKVGEAGVKRELTSFLPAPVIAKLMACMTPQKTNAETLAALAPLLSSVNGKAGLAEMQELIRLAEQCGIPHICFEPSLARGLDYYTGTVIEVFLKGSTVVQSAVLGGGRYDGLIGSFGASGEIPAVGLSFGLERIALVVEQLKKGAVRPLTELYLIPLDTIERCLGIAHELRRQGISVELELKQRKMAQAITHADSLGIPFVGIVGDDELARNAITIKNLKTRSQETLALKDVACFLKRQGI